MTGSSGVGLGAITPVRFPAPMVAAKKSGLRFDLVAARGLPQRTCTTDRGLVSTSLPWFDDAENHPHRSKS